MKFSLKKKLLVFYLAVLDLSCSMWNLVPRPGIEPGAPAMGALSLSHWPTREVARIKFS